MKHYAADMPAETVQGETFTKMSLILLDSGVHTEWKIYCNFITRKPEKDMQAQMKQLASNEMLVTMFPNVSTPSVYASCHCLSQKKFLTHEWEIALEREIFQITRKPLR